MKTVSLFTEDGVSQKAFISVFTAFFNITLKNMIDVSKDSSRGRK